MSNLLGVIRAVIGLVYVVEADGTQRLLKEGDRIYSGEEIVTGDSGAVSVSLPDGKTLDLGRNSHWTEQGLHAVNSAEHNGLDIASAQKAIADGADPTRTLEATAAGNEPPVDIEGGGGGHTLVQLDLTGQIIDPTAGFPTATPGSATPDIVHFDAFPSPTNGPQDPENNAQSPVAAENITATALVTATQTVAFTELTPATNTAPISELVPATHTVPITDLAPATHSVPLTELTPAEPPTPLTQLIPAEPPMPLTQLIPAEPSTPLTQLTPAEPPTPLTQLTPAEPPAPLTQLTPAEPPTPLTQLTPAEPPTPLTQLTPAEPPTPLTHLTQAEPPAPVTQLTPAEPPTALTQLTPAEPPTPLTQLTPAEPPTPLTQLTPAEPPTPLTPAEPPTPLTQLTPAEPSTPLTQLTPAEPPTPLTQLTPAEPPTPLTQLTPAEPHTPLTQLTPAEPPTPLTQLTPAEPPTPLAQLIPAEPPMPLTQLTPAEPPTPLTQLTPAEPPTPLAQLTPATHTVPATEVEPLQVSLGHVDVSVALSEVPPVATGSDVIQVNGGSGSPDGFDVKDGKIVAIGSKVRIWLSEGDQEPTCADHDHQIMYYSNGNPGGDSSYSDVFVVHQGSGYTQDGNHRDLDSVHGNSQPQGGADSHKDYIFVQAEDGVTPEASHQTDNRNQNVNTLDGVSVTYTTADGQHGSYIGHSSNQIEGVIFGDGKTHLASDADTTLEHVTPPPATHDYIIDVTATLTDDDKSDSLSKITLEGLPKGTEIMDGDKVVYTVGDDGKYVIDGSGHGSTWNDKITRRVPGDDKPVITGHGNYEHHEPAPAPTADDNSAQHHAADLAAAHNAPDVHHKYSASILGHHENNDLNMDTLLHAGKVNQGESVGAAITQGHEADKIDLSALATELEKGSDDVSQLIVTDAHHSNTLAAPVALAPVMASTAGYEHHAALSPSVDHLLHKPEHHSY